MKVFSILEDNSKLYLPENLSECDKNQYIEMSALIFRYQSQEIDFDDFCVHAVYKLLNMKHKHSPFGINDDLKFSNIAYIAQFIPNFFEEKNGQQVIKQSYINNPVPDMKILLKKYFGPSDSFSNLTFGEYTDALRLFHDFHATGEVRVLYLLAALFYRKKKSFLFFRKLSSEFDGDKREPYNSNSLEKRADLFKYAPFGFVYGAYLLFASFQKYLIEAKVLWSGQELDLSILFDVDSKTDATPTAMPGIGMDSVAFTIAESGTFGTLDQVRKTNFWLIIVRMYELRKTDIERKSRENARNK